MKSVAVALVALATPAAAAPPPGEPAATRAGEANLESLERRQGYTAALTLGPSLTFGSDVGTGGALSLHVGQVATPSTVIAFELNASGIPHRVTDMDGSDRLVTNSNTSVLLGAQRWLSPALFLRFSAGLGRYECKECGMPNASGVRANDRYGGFAGSVGAGVEFVRWRGFVLGVELHNVTLVTRDGVLSNTAIGLAFAMD